MYALSSAAQRHFYAYYWDSTHFLSANCSLFIRTVLRAAHCLAGFEALLGTRNQEVPKKECTYYVATKEVAESFFFSGTAQ